MDRRRFLRNTGAAFATLPLGWLATPATVVATSADPAKENDDIPIVDTHQHLWDLDKFTLPWLTKGSPLARNFVMADYLAATKGLNVVKSVYMEVAVDPAQRVREADYVLDICQRGQSPMVAAVISGHPGDEGFKKFIDNYKGIRFVKGVRQVLHDKEAKPRACLEEAFIRGVRYLGEIGMSFDLCVRAAELPDAARLVDACPDTRFILDHCGNADVQAKDRNAWQKDMAAIAKRKNVVCKISGIVASAKPGHWESGDLAPIIEHTAEVFGKQRIFFGGDWPVCTLAATYEQWVVALRSIVHAWKREDQRKLFHDNAVRLYGLK